MTWNSYLQLSARTVSPDTIPEHALADQDTRTVLHAVMGISGEAGELSEALKKTLFYGKPLDVVNVEEEVGDLMWYVAMLCRTLGMDLGQILDKNIAKLSSRYPEKFESVQAINRDLDRERRILEGLSPEEGAMLAAFPANRHIHDFRDGRGPIWWDSDAPVDTAALESLVTKGFVEKIELPAKICYNRIVRSA